MKRSETVARVHGKSFVSLLGLSYRDEHNEHRAFNLLENDPNTVQTRVKELCELSPPSQRRLATPVERPSDFAIDLLFSF